MANRCKQLGLALLLTVAICADAEAYSPTGRRRTGTVENVDHAARQLIFRADRQEKTKAYVWNKRTRFVREISFVEASALSKGTRTDGTVHSPFFGQPFVSRVILLPSAPSARSRR